ncbi:choice-of-anchor D domain-containing protein [Acidicapsa dinghuensis]|uniref:Choice-of-anchor D domain-containing protein n=1 Tax=Acidicapsa dinghuensis TaxID=2218256 RepID=A0ABW1EH03_9BACT|nr:choice-of-anchor D domain-containing protein [Acidicapsa dinghuensis]
MLSRNLVLPRVVSALVVSLAVAAVPGYGAAMPSGQSEQAVTGNVPNAYPGVKRIVAAVNENNLAILRGNTRPEARAQFDQGAVAADFPMKGMLLVLKRSAEQQAAFDAFVQSEYETGSPNYHQWLTPDEVGQKFGPAQEDIDTISQWLTSKGFTVDAVTKDRMTIRFSGTAGLVRSAFHTEIHRLSVKGEAHVANMSDPAIPAALAPVVVGVKALHNFFTHPMHRLGGQVEMDAETHTWKRVGGASVTPGNATGADLHAAVAGLKPDFGTGGTTSGEANVEDVAPYDFAKIYNVLPLWQAATPITGAGQTIAIVGRSNINLADVTAFRSAFGLPAYPSSPNPNVNQPGVSVVIPPSTTDPGDCPGASSSTSTCAGDLVENSLDVEWAGATAPGAHIILVASTSGTSNAYTDDGVWISASYIVNNDLAPIMNVSYGLCELGLGTAGNAAYNNLWQTATSEGIAVFAAAGDEGSAECDAYDNATEPYGAEYGLSVSGVASTPYDTAVGGTDFNWGYWDPTKTQSTYWSGTNNSTTQASANGYIPEIPWNDTCTNPLVISSYNSEFSTSYNAVQFCNLLAGGPSPDPDFVSVDGGSGGVSNCTTNDNAHASSCTGGYAKPSWQASVTGIPTDGKRDIPDVSFFASNGFSGSAYVICVSALATCSYSAATEPALGLEVGGTSVASPAMAGVMALINQKTGGNQGNPNAALYKLAAKETYSGCSTEAAPLTGSSCSFYDIDTGTNAMPCVYGSTSDCTGSSSLEFGVLSGWAGTQGFDLATGLGSLNVANVVNNFTTIPNTDIFVSETALAFGSVLTNTTSTAQTVTVSNNSNQALSFTSAVISGPNASLFTETNNCGTSIAIGASCTINVTFKPTAGGSFSATLTLTDGGTASPQTVALTGTGVVPAPAVGFSSGSLTFGSTLVGETSTAQSVTLTNTGTASLTITSVGITGSGATSFTQTNNCVGTVLAGKSCTINVSFVPTAAGSFSAAVSVTDNATGSPQSVSLTGTGAVPAPAVGFSPSSLSFAAQAVSTSSTAQIVILTNTGTASLVISSVGVTGTNAAAFTETDNCVGTVLAGNACTINVTFTPTAAGSLSATVSVTDNASGSPQTVSLTGTGTEPTGATLAFSASSQTVSPGSAGTFTLTATGSTGYVGPSTVTIKSCTLTGSPTGASDLPSCSITTNNFTIAAGASSGSGGVVTVSTTAATTQAKTGGPVAANGLKKWAGAGGAVLAFIVLLGIPARRRNWRSMLGLILLAGALATLSACGGGGGSGGGGGGNPGTTAGNYTFTVSGSDSNGVSANGSITLTVN